MNMKVREHYISFHSGIGDASGLHVIKHLREYAKIVSGGAKTIDSADGPDAHKKHKARSEQ
jgi:hypothetical protein